jgi:hypothetical protein
MPVKGRHAVLLYKLIPEIDGLNLKTLESLYVIVLCNQCIFRSSDLSDVKLLSVGKAETFNVFKRLNRYGVYNQLDK